MLRARVFLRIDSEASPTQYEAPLDAADVTSFEHDLYAKEQGKYELVLFKQSATDVGIDVFKRIPVVGFICRKRLRVVCVRK